MASELAGIILTSGCQRYAQGGRVFGNRAYQCAVPVIFLRSFELIDIDKIITGIVVNGHEPHSKARDIVRHVGGRINRRECVARGGFHHLHARSVVSPPVRIVDHFLVPGAERASAVGSTSSLCSLPRKRVDRGSARNDDRAQAVPRGYTCAKCRGSTQGNRAALGNCRSCDCVLPCSNGNGGDGARPGATRNYKC